MHHLIAQIHRWDSASIHVDSWCEIGEGLGGGISMKIGLTFLKGIYISYQYGGQFEIDVYHRSLDGCL